MKKYIEFINENRQLFNSLSDEELLDQLGALREEEKYITERISDINNILKRRKSDSDLIFSESLPESIFDFNEEQLDWIFEHHHGLSRTRYEISRNFYRQLFGVHDNGFYDKTNQTKFTISINSEYTFDFDRVEKTIKFLGDNLKKYDGSVPFFISFYHSDDFENIKYISDNEIYWNRSPKKYNIKDLLKDLIATDHSYSDELE